jgi:hypothetical protein
MHLICVQLFLNFLQGILKDPHEPATNQAKYFPSESIPANYIIDTIDPNDPRLLEQLWDDNFTLLQQFRS